VRLLPIALLVSALLEAQAPLNLEKVCTPADVDRFGLTCSEDEPCPVFLELSSVEANGPELFVSGNLHTAATTMYGLLLASADGGKTWREAQRIPSSTLEQIQFLDSQHGWVGGVKLEPLPRDPFLLATTDGGKTWRQNPLFEDTVYGSIQRFWFETADRGELVLERLQATARNFELYVSMTGGASWELEQTGKQPMRLAKAKPKESASWRVRPDRDSYLVERRTAGNDWEPAASFAIRAGECQ